MALWPDLYQQAEGSRGFHGIYKVVSACTSVHDKCFNSSDNSGPTSDPCWEGQYSRAGLDLMLPGNT